MAAARWPEMVSEFRASKAQATSKRFYSFRPIDGITIQNRSMRGTPACLTGCAATSATQSIEHQFRQAIDSEKRLCASITGPISTVTTTPFSTMTRPPITVYRAFCGAQNRVAATGSFRAPA